VVAQSRSGRHGQPTNFGFGISSGPTSGTSFRIEVLIPSAYSLPSPFTISGSGISGTVNQVINPTLGSVWNTGQLGAFLQPPIRFAHTFPILRQYSDRHRFFCVPSQPGSCYASSSKHSNWSALLKSALPIPLGSPVNGTANWHATAPSGAIMVLSPQAFYC